ncbi:MAG TPA: hypothetical protein VGF73_10830 [Chthoniobacterales bacterium]
MKTQNMFLVVTGGLLLVAGCVGDKLGKDTDPNAKYVIRFDTRTELADKPAFIAVLKRAVWYRNISFSPPQAGDPIGDHTGNVLPTPTIVNATITEDGQVNPSGLHVTQHVGFNRLADAHALLDAIKQ